MRALFGPGGNSDAFKLWGGKSTLDAPRFVSEIGLDAYEYEAGNGIASSPAMLSAIGKEAKKYGTKMSFHTPYFISLSGIDPEKAYLAGLLHDCAKSYTDEELLALCRLRNIEITEAELRAPYLLHAKYGAWMAEYVYGIDDPEICDAIRCHTTGAPGMNTLEKVIFVADYLEPGRNQAPHLHILRKLAEKDLDMTVHRILQDTLEYLQEKNAQIDPQTQETYRWINESIAEKGE